MKKDNYYVIVGNDDESINKAANQFKKALPSSSSPEIIKGNILVRDLDNDNSSDGRIRRGAAIIGYNGKAKGEGI